MSWNIDKLLHKVKIGVINALISCFLLPQVCKQLHHCFHTLVLILTLFSYDFLRGLKARRHTWQQENTSWGRKHDMDALIQPILTFLNIIFNHSMLPIILTFRRGISPVASPWLGRRSRRREGPSGAAVTVIPFAVSGNAMGEKEGWTVTEDVNSVGRRRWRLEGKGQWRL